MGPVTDTAAVFLVGLIGAVVGALMTELGRGIRERLSREATRQRRRDEFQRKTLLEAQEVLVEWIRATKKVPTDTPRFMTSNHEPFEKEESAGERLAILRERLLDDEARSLLEKLSETQADFLRATLAELVTAHENLTEQADRCLRRMGSLARGL